MKRLFIHIPKNGGMTVRRGLKDKLVLATRNNHVSPAYTTAVLNVMNEYGEHHGFEHARWRDLKPEIQALPAFALVRNPWARVVSRYTFAVIAGDKSGKQTFRKFLHERHRYGDLAYFWHRAIRGWYPQIDHVTDEDGNLRVDCLRLECDDLQKYWGLSKPLKHRNVSNRSRDYREFYDDESREIIADWYKRDIDFFGFTFDGPATRNIWTPSSSP